MLEAYVETTAENGVLGEWLGHVQARFKQLVKDPLRVAQGFPDNLNNASSNAQSSLTGNFHTKLKFLRKFSL